MERIEDLEAFVAVVDAGGLTAAARQLGRSLQSVSRSLAAVERDVGSVLVHRTTRRSAPTAAGLAFHHRIKAALSDIALAKMAAAGGHLAGRLGVGASFLFAPIYLVPAMAAFLDQHPQVSIDLRQSDSYANLTEEGIDVAVRIGAIPDSTLRRRKLGSLREVTFAAPGYLAKHGRPQTPFDLARHACVRRTAARSAGSRWRFRIEGAVQSLKVNGRFAATGAAATIEAVALGAGIGRAFLWQVRDRLEVGRVELVLSAFDPPPVPLHAVWQGAPSPLVRRFTDFLAARFAGERW